MVESRERTRNPLDFPFIIKQNSFLLEYFPSITNLYREFSIKLTCFWRNDSNLSVVDTWFFLSYLRFIHCISNSSSWFFTVALPLPMVDEAKHLILEWEDDKFRNKNLQGCMYDSGSCVWHHQSLKCID